MSTPDDKILSDIFPGVRMVVCAKSLRRMEDPQQSAFAERFGRHVRALRTKTGLDRKAVAAKTGVSPGFIRDIEIGDRRCMIDVAIRLAKTLGVSMNELCDFKATAHAPTPNPRPGRPKKTTDD